MFILHILPNFDNDRTKTLAGVCENVQNMLILTIQLTPMTLTLVGRPRSHYLDTPISYSDIFWHYCCNTINAKIKINVQSFVSRRPKFQTCLIVLIFGTWILYTIRHIFGKFRCVDSNIFHFTPHQTLSY